MKRILVMMAAVCAGILADVRSGAAQLDYGSEGGVQSFQADRDSWRREDGKRKVILQGISDSIGQAALENIKNAEQVFCYQVANRPNNYQGYTLNGMAVTGFCGVVAAQLKETIQDQFFSTEENINFVSAEKCIIQPKLMIRFVRGVDYTDMLISAPCHSFAIFYGGKVRTFNFKPGAEIIDVMVESFKPLTVPFTSPALLNQLLPVGVAQTQEQKQIVQEKSGPVRKWEENKPKAAKQPQKKGWNNLDFGFN